MINIIAWIGTICFAICFAPQVIKTMVDGNADGTSSLFIAILFVGEICYMIAVICTLGWIWWQLANYITNIMGISIILYYKVK